MSKLYLLVFIIHDVSHLLVLHWHWHVSEFDFVVCAVRIEFRIFCLYAFRPLGFQKRIDRGASTYEPLHINPCVRVASNARLNSHMRFKWLFRKHRQRRFYTGASTHQPLCSGSKQCAPEQPQAIQVAIQNAYTEAFLHRSLYTSTRVLGEQAMRSWTATGYSSGYSESIDRGAST